MEFGEVIESIRAEEASIRTLFGGDGRGVRTGLVRGRKGGWTRDPKHLAQLAEAADFLGDVMEGKRPFYHFQEVMTTSDFPNLFGQIIDRQLLANYQEAPYTWKQWCAAKTVPDFRTVHRYVVNGSEAVLAEVPQQTEYPESKLSDGVYSYAVLKYGRRIPFSWESMVNDDLDGLKDIPARFGKAARRSEEKFATQLMFDANGPHASMYTAGNKNIINIGNGATATNPALTIQGVQDGFAVLGNMLDTDGEPITYDAVALVVPPALEVIAQNIMNATMLFLGGLGQVGGGGAAGEAVQVNNWLKTKIQLAVNAYIPIIVTSGTRGNTSWALVASPTQGRPAYEMGHLRGHEMPEVFIKTPNVQTVGGGANDPMNGDFDTDSIEYKVRHVFGGVRQEPKATVASNGTGA
jgi:hypothetical protein